MPEAKSCRSTRAVRRPRLAASRATPAPVMPPPMTRTSKSPRPRRRRASARSKPAPCAGGRRHGSRRHPASLPQPAPAGVPSRTVPGRARGRPGIHRQRCQETIVGDTVPGRHEVTRGAHRACSAPSGRKMTAAAAVHLPCPARRRDPSDGRSRSTPRPGATGDDLAQDRVPDPERAGRHGGDRRPRPGHGHDALRPQRRAPAPPPRVPLAAARCATSTSTSPTSPCPRCRRGLRGRRGRGRVPGPLCRVPHCRTHRAAMPTEESHADRDEERPDTRSRPANR